MDVENECADTLTGNKATSMNTVRVQDYNCATDLEGNQSTLEHCDIRNRLC